MKKITFLILLCSTFVWSQTVRVDVSEQVNVSNVELLANFGGNFAFYQAQDNGNGIWSFDVSTSTDDQNEYIWRITFTDMSDFQENMASKIGGTGIDNDVAVGQAFNTDYVNYCNRIVVIGDPDPPTFYFNSFRQPGVAYSEITVTAASGGNPYYIFYSVNGFSEFGGPGAIDNGDGTHTAFVRPDAAFEYKWVENSDAGTVNSDNQEDLLTCTDDDVQINTDNSSFANRIHAAGENDDDTFNTCPPPLSTSEFAFEKVNIYPNPTSNKWNMLSTGLIDKVQVFDALGKSVITITPNTNSVSIDATSLTSGLYFARITGENGIKSTKLIKE